MITVESDNMWGAGGSSPQKAGNRPDTGTHVGGRTPCVDLKGPPALPLPTHQVLKQTLALTPRVLGKKWQKVKRNY